MTTIMTEVTDFADFEQTSPRAIHSADTPNEIAMTCFAIAISKCLPEKRLIVSQSGDAVEITK